MRLWNVIIQVENGKIYREVFGDEPTIEDIEELEREYKDRNHLKEAIATNCYSVESNQV